MRYCLGKRPARPDAITFKFAKYFAAADLPQPPLVFGKPWLVPQWNMLGNDTAGDCVFAGAAHETMQWRADGSAPPVSFTDATTIADYSALTGYKPGDDATDQGTDVQQAASYRQTMGIVDAAGNRHKIDAYVSLHPGDLHQLALATYLMGAVGIGVQMPSSASDQFDNLEPWRVIPGDSMEGGHYVPCIGRNSHGYYLIVTWGRLQAVTPAWLMKFMDEGVAYLSLERMSGLVSPQGFDEATLRSDLATLKAAA